MGSVAGSGRDRIVASDPVPPSFDLLVVGHTNLDRFLHVPRLPDRDRTVPVVGHETRLGGTAANIARVAARLGVRTALHSFVGTDFPRSFREELRRDGVDLGGLCVVPGATSPTCYIVEDLRGAQVTLIEQGPMERPSRRALPASLVGRSRWVHLTTGDPAYLLEILRLARTSGHRVAADPAQEIHYRWSSARLRKLLEGSEIFFGNRSETLRAQRLLGLNGPRALTKLTPLVVATHGALGSVAYSRGGTERVAGTPVAHPQRITGAGDAFRGGFYAAWFGGAPVRECLRSGARAATTWLRRGGPSGFPRRVRRSLKALQVLGG